MKGVSALITALYQSFPTTIQQDKQVLQQLEQLDAARQRHAMQLLVTCRLSIKQRLEAALRAVLQRSKREWKFEDLHANELRGNTHTHAPRPRPTAQSCKDCDQRPAAAAATGCDALALRNSCVTLERVPAPALHPAVHGECKISGCRSKQSWLRKVSMAKTTCRWASCGTMRPRHVAPAPLLRRQVTVWTALT